MELIKGDSSDIFEFSSKQVDNLDSTWEGSWTISESLGSAPIIQGSLIKNENIYNNDSLIGEDYNISYKIFEPKDDMKVEFTETKANNISSISGKIFKIVMVNDVETEVPYSDTYITFNYKGKFVKYTRTKMVKTDALGNFILDINPDKTVKIPQDTFFIFQLMPLQSEQLEEDKTYNLNIEVRQFDINNVLIFRKEVMQRKLKILKQGVL